MSFASKLKELRIKTGQSLQQVADAVKTSKTHIWDMEQGRSSNPSRELLLKIAAHFRVSLSELVGEDPNAPDEPSEMIALYRDLKALDEQERRMIETIMRSMKDNKKMS